MTDVRARDDRGTKISPDQRDSLCKWRWLGLGHSTPAFKACLVLPAAVAFALTASTQAPMP